MTTDEESITVEAMRERVRQAQDRVEQPPPLSPVSTAPRVPRGASFPSGPSSSPSHSPQAQGAHLALARQCLYRGSWTGIQPCRCWFTCFARLGPPTAFGGRETNEAHCLTCVRSILLQKVTR